MILHALPRNLLVPIDTMTAKDDANGDQRGIRVGDTTYLLRDAAFSTPSGSVLQVLVLKRNTLEFVSNRKYLEGSALAEDLSHLDSSHLVIVVLQPGGLPGFQYGDLGKAVGQIGVEDMGASLPKNTGLMSVIGVPGMDPGDADVNILTGSTGPIAPMKGYLVRDQYDNFGYVSSERQPFSFAPKPADPCSIDDFGLHLPAPASGSATWTAAPSRPGPTTGGSTPRAATRIVDPPTAPKSKRRTWPATWTRSTRTTWS